MLIESRSVDSADRWGARSRIGIVEWVRYTIAPPGGRDIFFWLLALLLLGDAIFIVAHIGGKFLAWRDLLELSSATALLLTTDNGVAEQFNYSKLLAAVFMMAIAWRCSRVPVYAAFAVVLFILLLDDSLQIHEIGGGWIAHTFGFVPMLGFRDVDFGELIVMGGTGAIALVTIAAGYLCTPKHRAIFVPCLLGAMGLLVFCGVFIDMVDIPLTDVENRLLRSVLGLVFSILEDGGEMVAVSFLCAYAAAALIWESQRAGISMLAPSA